MNTLALALPEMLEKLNIEAKAQRIGRNTEKDWGERDSWTVELSFFGSPTRYMKTEFHMGIGHKGKAPDVAAVIHSLITDADCVDDCGYGTSFKSFCDNLGYSEDSRKALETYLACQKVSQEIHAFLGDSFEEVAEVARQY